MKCWGDFIKEFHGQEVFDPGTVACDPTGGQPLTKDTPFSIRVYRAIWTGMWVDDNRAPIAEGYEVLCTPSYNTLLLDQWVESCVNTDGSITYSYYMKIDTCDAPSVAPPFPTFI